MKNQDKNNRKRNIAPPRYECDNPSTEKLLQKIDNELAKLERCDVYSGKVYPLSSSLPKAPAVNNYTDSSLAFCVAVVNCLRRLINELPSRRDWLDPDLEKVARGLLKEADRFNIKR